jgi:serpin B
MAGGGEATMPEQSAPATTGSGVAAADDAFGADLYRLLSEQAPDTVFSPVSVASVLQMALCGARGQTAAELAGALHLDGSQHLDGPQHLDGSPEAAAEALKALAGLVASVTAGGAVTFRAPAAVWVQAGLALQPSFTDRLGEAVAETDFAGAPQRARAEINRVVAEQTENKITGLLPARAIDGQTRLVLTSAIYLKAGWEQTFAEPATADAPFYPDGPDRPSRTVPMMHGTAARMYVRGDGYQAVLLPYRGGSLAMAVVLPDGPLSALGPAIAAGGVQGLLTGTARFRVTLALPRFRLEAAFDLIPVLRRLGVQQAFTDGADFGGITETARLLISAIAHKAYVDVDEQGTEAAAATAVSLRPAAAFHVPPPVTMTVDRPFLFAILHTPTGLPLFLGQVSHP